MKKVILTALLFLFVTAPALADPLVYGCFDDSCSIVPTDIYHLCSTCSADAKPILKIVGSTNFTNFEYTFLGRTGDKTFEIKALIYERGGVISNNTLKLFFEKDSIIPLGEGYKLKMLDLKGNTLIYQLIKP